MLTSKMLLSKMSLSKNTLPFSPSSEAAAPLYDQVMRWLTAVIESDFAHDERFFTERDLIEKLGVSQPTVRRALQELVNQGRLHRHVGRGTFVQKFKRTRLLGIIVPEHRSPVITRQVEVFAGLCDAYECNLRVHHTRKGESLRDMARSLKANPHEERMVFLGHSQEAAWTLFDELEHRGFRTVCAVPFPQGYPGKCVSVDPYISAKLMMDHLTQLGHRRITFVINEPTELASVQMRVATLRDEVARRGLTDVVFHDCKTPNWADSFAATIEAMPAVLAAEQKPTAIVPISGSGAWAALRYAGMHRLRVPEDFSLVAFDDLPGGDMIYPALTSLGADETAFSRQVLDLLWSDEPEPRQASVPTAIIERESTAPIGGR